MKYKEYNFENVDELFSESLSYNKIEKAHEQEYAIKYLFGMLQNRRRLLQSDKSKGLGTKGVEDSLALIKKMIGTIISLPIPAEPKEQSNDAE